MIESKKTEVKTTLKDINIEDVLKIVLKPLQINFGICFIILIVFLTYGGINGTQNPRTYKMPFGELNTCNIKATSYCVISCITVAFMILIFIIVSVIEFNSKYKFGILIITSIIILFVLVYLTGGILDSPFTAALGIYVASFYIIQERNDLKQINLILLLIVLALTIIPYFFFSSGCDQNIIQWNSDFSTNMLRLSATILLIALAGFSGDKVNKDLTEMFNKKNNLIKNEMESA